MKDNKSKSDIVQPSSHADVMKDIVADPRFSHVHFDKKYRTAPAYKKKTVIDSRFKSILKNNNARDQIVQDPRGRPVNFRNIDNFSQLYTLGGSSTQEGDETESSSCGKESDSSENSENSSDEEGNSTIDEDKDYVEKKKLTTKLKEEEIAEELKKTLCDDNCDIARGYQYFSDDSSDDDSSSSDEDDDLGEFKWGELDHEAKWDDEDNEIEETRRFAVCNMNWDQVKCTDLMVLFSSFAPAAGVVEKVSLYLSDYGRERIKEEEIRGPEEIIKLSQNDKKDSELDYLLKISEGNFDESSDEPTAKHLEALRVYQRNKLKYYYAVVECDSVETAKVIYTECDRKPFGMVGTLLDLRYIPNDMEFEEHAEDEVTGIPDSCVTEGIQPDTISATNPKCTWDETDYARKMAFESTRTNNRKKSNIDLDVLNKYVANSSDEEEDEEASENEENESDSKKQKKQKYKALIDSLMQKDSKKDEIHKEFTFELKGDHQNSDLNSSDANDHEESSTIKKKKKSNNREESKKKSKKNKSKSDTNDSEELAFSDDELPGDVDVEDFCSPDSKKKDKKKKKKTKNDKKKNSDNESEDETLKLLLMDQDEEQKKHFSMRDIAEEYKNTNGSKKSSKIKKNKEQDFKIDVEDPRFASLFSGDVNIDPSHSHYVKTKPMIDLAEELHKKRKSAPSKNQEGSSNKRAKLISDDLSSLIQKVKSKTKLKK